jgi:ribonuclease Z
MSVRELVVLGTASQLPTRERNHNGYLLRWDDEALLFDPGEGTQRQLTLAGASASRITHICITHLHGDHSFGLPGILQRLAVDRVTHPVDLWFPADAALYVERLCGAAVGRATVALRVHPADEGVLADTGGFRLLARRLDHRIDTLGYRLEEPAGVRMLPDRLEALGIRGPDIGRLQAEGEVQVDGRTVRLEEASVPRRGHVFAFVMDTRLCDAAFALAEEADMLVAEATFLSEHADLAADYGHLTAAQAALIARDARARLLVLTHFSQRYRDLADRTRAEAAAVFDGDIVVAEDLMRVGLPPRR